MDLRRRTDFRVIAEGDDCVGRDLVLTQALAVVDAARQRGYRYVAIVDDSTGALVDERKARAWARRGPPPLPDDPLVPCPACEDEGGVPSGDVLVQLPSGTWVRDTCQFCHGQKRVHRDELARRNAETIDESAESPTAPVSAGPRRVDSGTRPRVARVLVVHDRPLLAETLRSALSGELEVRVVNDARRALASMMAGDWYDAVLCGVTMPGMNGIELRNRVHATWPEQAERIMFIGDKPLDMRALSALIRRLASGALDALDAAGARR